MRLGFFHYSPRYVNGIDTGLLGTLSAQTFLPRASWKRQLNPAGFMLEGSSLSYLLQYIKVQMTKGSEVLTRQVAELF